jgi:hypothetical protein
MRKTPDERSRRHVVEKISPSPSTILIFTLDQTEARYKHSVTAIGSSIRGVSTGSLSATSMTPLFSTLSGAGSVLRSFKLRLLAV